MASTFFEVMREHDLGANAHGVDLAAIAEKLSKLPPAEAERWLEHARTSSAPVPVERSSARFDTARGLDVALTLRDASDPLTQSRSAPIVDSMMVEWGQRAAFEAWAGSPLTALDVPKALALVKRLKGHRATSYRFIAGRMIEWSQVFQRSRDAAGLSLRSAPLSNLLGPMRKIRGFTNPCRPLKVPASAYPMVDVVPRVPSPSWKLPVRILDARMPKRRGAPDKPPIVLLHGHSSLAEEYETLIDALRAQPATADVRIVVPDLPGYGYSANGGLGSVSTRIYVEFIRQLMRQLGIPRYVPAGGSLGGNLTMQLLAAAPREEIPAGIAWSVVSWSPQYEGMKHYKNLATLGAELGEEVFWAVYNIQKQSWVPSGGDPHALDASDTYRREVNSPEYRRAYFDLIIDQCGVVHLDKVSQIDAPVLLMAGKKDDGCPFQVHTSMRSLATLLKKEGKATVGFFDDFQIGDHAMAAEEPKLVAEKLAGWYAAHAMG